MKKKKNIQKRLNYHEGLSYNQVKIIIQELGLDIKKFNDWIIGQGCPIVPRYDAKGKIKDVLGYFEYDIFRWIYSQRIGGLCEVKQVSLSRI